MNLITRAKGIIASPNHEWDITRSEAPNINQIITGYVIPLAGAAAIAAFIGYAFIGINVFGYRVGGMNWGLSQALTIFLGALLSVFITSLVIDQLAPSFSSEKNFGRSLQLVAYSFTPAWIGGLLAVIPALAFIGGIFGLYGLYLLYLGLPKLKNTPEDKRVGYFVVTILVTIVIYFVIGWILTSILMNIFNLSYGIANHRM
jgi:Yip1 domain